MKGVLFSLKSILHRPLSSILSVLLFGFGVAIIVIILLTSSFLKSEITNNAKGIDMVVGAKGSPLQIILCNIFHIDFPTGNISLKDANNLSRNRLVKSAIPISLGDSYESFRVVGTSKNYLELYGAEFGQGSWPNEGMHAVIGAKVALSLAMEIGDEFVSAHGLSEGASGHDEHPFRVIGKLNPTGTVIDNLILVPIHSIWEVHDSHDEHEHSDSHEGDVNESLNEQVELVKLGISVTREQLEENEITSMLIAYRSPMAAVQLPRIVNETSNLQAASPAFETARLYNIIGVGVDVVNILGLIIVIISAISVFIGLINSLKERKYELAILRSMGGSRLKIFGFIFKEGLMLTFLGSLLGFLLGHLGFYSLIQNQEAFASSGIYFINEELSVLLGSFVIGIIASIIPAILAYKSDISETLAKA